MANAADSLARHVSETQPVHPSRWTLSRLRAALSGGDVAVISFVFSIVVGVVCQGWVLLAALVFCLALAAVVYPGGLRVLAHRRTWILLALLIASSTLVGPDPVWALGPFGVSLGGAVAGANMVMRALIIIVAVMGFVSTVPIDHIGSVLERTGLHGLGFAVGVAFNLLPLLERALVTSWQAMRLRAGLRRPLTAGRLLLVAAVTSSLRLADEVVLAAEARAFDPSAARTVRFAWRPRAIPFAMALAVATALFIWATY